MKRRKKAKRLSPYRQLEAELANARKNCEDAVAKYIEALVAVQHAMRFVDRLMPQSEHAADGWTHADGKRLAELREFAQNGGLPRPTVAASGSLVLTGAKENVKP